MIRILRIQNFALIDAVEVNFHSGFTVITGETGSGKSILMNALNLILGERASFDVIGPAADRASVEVEVDVADFGLKSWFKANDLDYFDNCIIRREISVQGRSRAFVNDAPVQLTLLKYLTSRLVHIHSQYNTLELKDRSYQLFVVDALAGLLAEREKLASCFRDWKQSSAELSSIRTQIQEIAAQSDYEEFQRNELRELELDQYNYDELAKELTVLSNADELRNVLEELSAGISDDGSLLDKLRYHLAAVRKYEHALDDLHERLNGVLFELEEIERDAGNKLSSLEVNPSKIQLLTDKLDAYNRMLFKHKCSNASELKAFIAELESNSQNNEELHKREQSLSVQVEQQTAALSKQAKELHTKREAAIPQMEKRIVSLLELLKLENTRLSFRLETRDEITIDGEDTVEMLFSPNTGVPMVPVHKAASGGELSRVMLALQSLLAEKTRLRSVFFDEIDTGVSGEVAQKVGETLQRMGNGMQVIAITHLPQVAAKGGQHLKVLKAEQDGISRSRVVELSQTERIEETARLMSGDTINQAALDNARALMNS